MKKLILLFILILGFSLSALADVAVTMVSYEQRWLDSEGTLALRNNSNEDIKDVQFRITYLDMSNNPMDYEDYSRRVTIAPGMVRKVDIPAYEHDRFYHYYRTPQPLGNPTFKIRFKLLSHNLTVAKPKKVEQPAEAEVKEIERVIEQPVQPQKVEQPVVSKTKEVEKVVKPKVKKEAKTVEVAKEDVAVEEKNELKQVVVKNKEPKPIVYKEGNGDSSLVKDLVRLFLFGVSAGLFAIVGEMARKRNKNAIGWIVLSMFFTPFLMILILLFLGDNKKDYYYRS